MREINYTWSCPYCDEKGETKWLPNRRNGPMQTHIKEKHLDEAFQTIIKCFKSEQKKQLLDQNSDFHTCRVTVIPKSEQ